MPANNTTFNKIGVEITHLRFLTPIEATWDLPTTYTGPFFGAAKPWPNDEVGWQKIRPSKRRSQK